MINKLINKVKDFLSVYATWRPSKIVVLLLLLIPTFWFALFEFKLDNDIWFLLNTGENILKEGFTRIEPFTMHVDFSYMSQQWLSSVIFYLIYNNLGIHGMLCFVILMNIMIVFLLYRLLLLITNNKVKVSIIITLLTDIMLLFTFITTRPQIFDIIFFLIEIYCLELYVKNSNKKSLVLLPIISLLLINFHASMWLLFFVFILPYIGEWIYNKIKHKNIYNIKPIFIALFISFSLGFINPYKVDAIKYLFNSYGIDYINNFIMEMMPVTIDKSIMIYAYIFLILFSYYYNKNKNVCRYLFFFLGTLYLGLSHYKGLLFLFITSILSLGYNFKDIFKESIKEMKVTKLNYFIYSEIILFMLLIIGFNIDIKYEKEMDIYKVVNYLDQELVNEGIFKDDLDLYVDYNNGGYLEYRGYLAYVDPRAEIFLKSNNKKEDIIKEYYDLQKGLLDYREFLNKYNFIYLLVGNDDVLFVNISESDGYKRIYEYKDDSNKIKYVIFKKVLNENN